jgi:MoaA/NifB/PqqE/SkfB family radical SAM enzyme
MSITPQQFIAKGQTADLKERSAAQEHFIDLGHLFGRPTPSNAPSWKLRKGPCGLQFFERSSGLNVLFDELTIPANQWSAAPRFVSIALTNTCNLRCSYCFAPKQRAALDSVQVKDWLSEIDEQGCLGVGFGGGEPTLHNGLPELFSFAFEQTGLAASFTTHATSMTDSLANELRGHVSFVRVSMDGVGPTYQRLRGRPFDLLQKGIALIRSIAPFGVNYVVNRFTIGDLDQAVEFAHSQGASELALLPQRPVGDVPGIDADTRERLTAWVRRSPSPLRLSISEQDQNDMPCCDPLEPETGLRAYVHVSADGLVKRTSFDNHGVKVGPDGRLSAIARLASGSEGKT